MRRFPSRTAAGRAFHGNRRAPGISQQSVKPWRPAVLRRVKPSRPGVRPEPSRPGGPRRGEPSRPEDLVGRRNRRARPSPAAGGRRASGGRGSGGSVRDRSGGAGASGRRGNGRSRRGRNDRPRPLPQRPSPAPARAPPGGRHPGGESECDRGGPGDDAIDDEPPARPAVRGSCPCGAPHPAGTVPLPVRIVGDRPAAPRPPPPPARRRPRRAGRGERRGGRLPHPARAPAAEARRPPAAPQSPFSPPGRRAGRRVPAAAGTAGGPAPDILPHDSPNFTGAAAPPPRLHADRTARGNRDRRDPGLVAAPRRPGGPRGGPRGRSA